MVYYKKSKRFKLSILQKHISLMNVAYRVQVQGPNVSGGPLTFTYHTSFKEMHIQDT